MVTFEELAARPDDLDVALGAALLARDAYPNLDPERVIARLHALAEGLEDLSALPPTRQAERVSEHVYVTLGFHGNETDYYDPRNSLLPDVIERRTGIPISLALVYIEVGRQRGVPARGVSFPGHFLVRVDGANDQSPEAAVFVDPFFAGRVLASPDLKSLLEKVAGQASRGKPDTVLDLYQHLAPASGRAILQRWLMNLRGIYLQRGDDARAMLVLDRLVSLTPQAAWPLRERGLLAAKLGAIEAARADLERAIKLSTKNDAEQLRAELDKLGHRKQALH